ncbi:DNA primase [Chthonobacter rhizosphaerae]|uniref:DNA primase n=1 Tax=Chthonobacter rhizosphaerae TaxID=2735553 RepID=UPI0015EF5459|nr:DNA primase [Chthonobacter rhizosphaerae]
MRFSSSVLDDIRNRLPISAVVARKVTWDKRKTQPARGDWWACCPFHQEKSPSFHCDDRRGIYHCFGCGASGDHFKFVTETEGLSFPEAVERLAETAGVSLPKPDPREREREAFRVDIVGAVEIAAKFFEAKLRAPEGKPARDYLTRRGLTPKTVAEFRLGYAPDDRDALKRHLLQNGVTEDTAVTAGLLRKPEDGRSTYDYFRGRVVIPIHDERCRVVAFGGRVLDPDGQPKYLNSPETPVFNKGTMLFNVHRAREAAHKSGTMIVTEGYMDAIAVHQAGIRNVVAALGTAFTEDHIARLWRFAPEPVICFDGDKAGVGAAHRAIDRILPLLKSGQSFNFCFLPDGQDPDDLIKASGADGFLAELAKARPLSEVLWDREVAVARIDTPERKAALEARIEELVRQIRDDRVARRYRLALRVKLSELFWAHDRKSRGGQGPRGGAKESPGANAADVQPLDDTELASVERILLGLCVEYPDLYEANIERLAVTEFKVKALEDFKRALYRIAVDLDAASVASFYEGLDGRFYFVLNEVHGDETRTDFGAVLPRGHRLRERMPILKFHPSQRFVENCFESMLERLSIRSLAADIEHDMDDVGADTDESAMARLFELSRELNRRREELARREQELAEEAKAIRQATTGSNSATPVLFK